MTKKRIALAVCIAVILCLLAAVIIETSVATAKQNLYGEWKGEGVTVDFKTDGTAIVNGLLGKWDYSFFKVKVSSGGSVTEYKCDGNTLTGKGIELNKQVSDKLEPELQVNFFKTGFFGYGDKGNFKYWSFSHFLPIILYGLAIFLIYRYRNALREWKHEENFRFVFAAAMLLAEMSYFWRLLYVGSSDPTDTTLLDKLPLQVCEWTCILAIFMITKKSKWLYPICFYVCMTIGVFPLLTPSVIVTTGPAYFRYYQYWLEHILPPIAVLYMTFVHGFKPTKKGIISAVGFMGVLTTFAVICNAKFDNANYLYLSKGTAAGGGGSIMDPIFNLVGGSLPLLLILLTSVVIGIFFVAYYAYVLICRLNAKLSKKEQTQEAAVEENAEAKA